jgi:hypothetical protein
MNSSTLVLGSMQIDEHPAMFALTEHESLSLSSSSLGTSFRLAMAQASGTYQVILLPQDLPRDGVEFLKRQLLSAASDHQEYTTRYEYLPDEGSIRMQISQHFSSGIVRRVWETTLPKTGTLYEFTEQVLQWQQQSQWECDHLQTALRQVEHDRAAWNDTADKLECVWQDEKSELLDNFLVLYQKQKEMTTQAQERVQQLEKLLQEKEQELRNVTNNNQKNTTDNRRMLLQNEPDDMDSELYPQELVEQLADGKNVRGTKRPSTTVTKTLVPQKRRNQATGAMEYYDEDEAVTDLLQYAVKTEDFTDDVKKQKKKSRDTEKKNSQKSKRKDDLKKARGKKSKDDDSTDSAGNYSYSSELDSDVLAQLAAMKKRGD